MSTGLVLADVVVGDRARKDHGDLTSLVESIREHGLLQPIGVLPGNRLLFGGRRLEACRQLGMESIAVTYPTTRDDALSLLRAERDENTCRKDMTPEELIDMTTAIEEMARAENAAKRNDQLKHGDERPSSSVEGNGSKPDRSTWTSEVVADALGMSRASYDRTKQVVITARDETAPEELRDEAQAALADLNAGKTTISGAVTRVRNKRKIIAADQPAIVSPRHRGPPSTRHIIKVANLRAIVDRLSGHQIAYEGITAADPKLTSEEATRLSNDLFKSIAALQRLNRLIKERAK